MIKNAILGSALLLAFPLSASALNLTINGQTHAVTTVDISSSQNGIVITTNPVINLGNGGTSPSDPVDPAPPPPPPPPPSTGGGVCGETPAGVTLAGTINWAAPGGQIMHALGKDETKAVKFTTTSGTQYEGQLATAETSSNGAFRTMWVSECPGAPVASVPATCVADGREVGTLRWAQYNRSFRCVLEPNKTYYLNVKSAQRDSMEKSTCLAANCSFYQMTYTNGKP